MSSSGRSSTGSWKSIADADPVTRNALRYTVSAREYELLHKYLISRTPVLKERSPKPEERGAALRKYEDYNAATIRVTVRAFLATYTGLKLWEFVTARLSGRRTPKTKNRVSVWKSADFRLSVALSSILLFHRLLYRFLTRLRESLRTEEAKPFRRRNPRVAQALTSKLAPAVGASIAGLFLAVSPADQTRMSIAIYVFSRALEFWYNYLDTKGYFRNKPWWLGSWLFMPLSCGQLLHAFVFDRDCFPASYGKFILNRSPEYIQQRPDDYPTQLSFPDTFSIVDSLANVSELKWPQFVSPILFPNAKTLPISLSFIAPITDPAHPAIKRLSCAILHPTDPSCLRTHLKYYLRAFPAMTKFFALMYTVFSLPRYRTFIASPIPFLNSLALRILRTSFFLTSAIGSAWGSICLLQRILPRNVLPTSRWFLSGFIAGMWAFLERGSNGGHFLYSARMSLDSLWKVGTKRGWWKGVKNGDVLLFVASLMIANVVYERNAGSATGGIVRKGLAMMRTDDYAEKDLAATRKPDEEAKLSATKDSQG